MGPVHLDLPEDVAVAPTREPIPLMPVAGAKVKPAPDEAIAQAGKILAAAKRPIAVIGSTAMRLPTRICYAR